MPVWARSGCTGRSHPRLGTAPCRRFAEPPGGVCRLLPTVLLGQSVLPPRSGKTMNICARSPTYPSGLPPTRPHRSGVGVGGQAQLCVGCYAVRGKRARWRPAGRVAAGLRDTATAANQLHLLRGLGQTHLGQRIPYFTQWHVDMGRRLVGHAPPATARPRRRDRPVTGPLYVPVPASVLRPASTCGEAPLGSA